jgi:ribosomal protein S12 methylthiotransferase accessory factor YcaO
MQDLDAEAAADRAATEIVELFEQGLLNLTGSWNATQPSLARKGANEQEDNGNQMHGIATTQVDRTEFTGQDDDGIPDWVIAESKAMSREVTPSKKLLF